jgi:hypothetical protein
MRNPTLILLRFISAGSPIIPKMKSAKYEGDSKTNERLDIIHEFLGIILAKETEQTLADIHILEYEDMTYDVVLESEDGEVKYLTPCFDLKFNEKNQIIAFGW